MYAMNKLDTPLSETELAMRLKVLGDPHRMRILRILLSPDPVCVSRIAEETGVSVAVASHHLRALASLDILAPVRDGKHVCYRLVPSSFTREITRIIARCRS